MNMSRKSITRLFSNAKTDFGFREVPSDFKESLVKVENQYNELELIVSPYRKYFREFRRNMTL